MKEWVFIIIYFILTGISRVVVDARPGGMG